MDIEQMKDIFKEHREKLYKMKDFLYVKSRTGPDLLGLINKQIKDVEKIESACYEAEFEY